MLLSSWRSVGQALSVRSLVSCLSEISEVRNSYYFQRAPLNFSVGSSHGGSGQGQQMLIRVNIRCHICLQQATVVSYFAHLLSPFWSHTTVSVAFRASVRARVDCRFDWLWQQSACQSVPLVSKLQRHCPPSSSPAIPF